MIIKSGNIFYPESYNESFVDAICITTNGVVKQNGHAVMGAGVARQAASRWPSIPKTLGAKINFNGNVVQIISKRPSLDDEYSVVAFPTKPVSVVLHRKKWGDITDVLVGKEWKYKDGDIVPGYYAKSTKEIIERSLKQLVQLANREDWTRVALPIPGIGHGDMEKSVVMGLLNYLDDRFIVVEYESNYSRI
jgi:hypothetical protein